LWNLRNEHFSVLNLPIQNNESYFKVLIVTSLLLAEFAFNQWIKSVMVNFVAAESNYHLVGQMQ